MAKPRRGGPKTAKRTRNFNPKVFRSKRAYSFAEIAELLHTHIRTVQSWRSEGLKIVDDGIKPFLVMGQDIQDFLRDRAARRKKPLKPGEFFCPKCQAPRKSQPEDLRIERTKRMLGANHRQVIVKGICQNCGSRLCLFSSEQKIDQWLSCTRTPAEQSLQLESNRESSTNTDILKVNEYA